MVSHTNHHLIGTEKYRYVEYENNINERFNVWLYHLFD